LKPLKTFAINPFPSLPASVAAADELPVTEDEEFEDDTKLRFAKKPNFPDPPPPPPLSSFAPDDLLFPNESFRLWFQHLL
jgi:hypothetical protein